MHRYTPTTTWVNIVVEMLPLVQPDLGEPRVVVVHHSAGAAREGIGRRLAEHVADVRARRDLKPPAAHPHLARSYAVTYTCTRTSQVLTHATLHANTRVYVSSHVLYETDHLHVVILTTDLVFKVNIRTDQSKRQLQLVGFIRSLRS